MKNFELRGNNFTFPFEKGKWKILKIGYSRISNCERKFLISMENFKKYFDLPEKKKEPRILICGFRTAKFFKNGGKIFKSRFAKEVDEF